MCVVSWLFVWLAGNQDDTAIEMAFSKKKVDERKEWLSNFQPGTFLDNSAENISYSEFIHKVCVASTWLFKTPSSMQYNHAFKVQKRCCNIVIIVQHSVHRTPVDSV
jgi:hypothetical protein